MLRRNRNCTSDYVEVFQARGSSYDLAMRNYPTARDEEFQQLVRRASPKPGDCLADIPAGSGYLKRHLPDSCHWLGHEPCTAFGVRATTHQNAQAHFLPLPWSKETIDIAVSLAGVHHLDDKRPLFKEIFQVVRPGGKFVLSDVLEGSAVAHFLDDFVGRNNATGHDGSFLNRGTLATLEESGWRIDSAEVVNFHWCFSSVEDMEDFCTDLFGLRGLRRGEIFQAINTILSVVERPNGKLGMAWSLFTIVSER